MALVLFALSSSSLDALQPASIPLRLIALLMMALGAATRKRIVTEEGSSNSNERNSLTAGLILIGVGNIGLLMAISYNSSQPAAYFNRIPFVVAEIATLCLVVSRYTHRELVCATRFALALLIFASLTLGVTSPEIAVEQGRLRGVLENANTLGWAAALSSMIVFLRPSRNRIVAAGILIASVGTLSWTASRASLLALVVLAVISPQIRVRTRVFGAWLLTILFALFVLRGGSLEQQQIFRSINSRVGNFAVTDYASREAFWFGLGDQIDRLPASSPLAAIVAGGAIGFASLLLSYVGLLRLSFTKQKLAGAVGIAAVVNSLFENWMTAVSGPVFFVTVVAIGALAASERSIETASPARGVRAS